MAAMWVKEKMQEWLANGCQLGWLMDTTKQKIYIYELEKELTILEGFDRFVSGGNVLPEFEMDFRELR